MSLLVNAWRKAGRFLGIVVALGIGLPMFWMMVFPLWLPFTPAWFDLASFVAAGVSTLIAIVIGASERPFDYKAKPAPDQHPVEQ
jgi:hypothetical protein